MSGGIRIGLNGFGRIGRTILRATLSKGQDTCGGGGGGGNLPQVVAINDPFLQPKHLAKILRYDSTNGRLKNEIEVNGKTVKIDGKPIEVLQEEKLNCLPWTDVDYVVECSGVNTTKDLASQHLRDHIKNVIISTISPDCPMFVMGVNHESYESDMKVISNASCTTNCLAPLLYTVHEAFKIEFALTTTIHAVTPSQSLLDSCKENYRMGRGALQNIVPTTISSAEAVTKIIPDLDGRVTGTSVRVPIANGCLLDVTILLSEPFTLEEIKQQIKEASTKDLEGILGYSDDELVSSDIRGDPRSSIFDAKASIALNDCYMKLMVWYDNEWGYSNRILDLISYIDGKNKESKESGSKCGE